MNWENYIGDRLIQKRDGFYVIKPVTAIEKITPLTCPVCEYVMRTCEDEKSYTNFSCCESCETNWARPNKDKWNEGWRPTQEEIFMKIGRKKINITFTI